MLAFALAVAVQLSGAPSGVEPAAGARSAAGAFRKGADPAEVICRTDAATGSRISAKTCRTRGEWDKLARDSATFMHGETQSACNGLKPGSPC